MNRIAISTTVSLFMSLAVFGYAQQPAQDSAPPTQEQPNKPREVPPPPRQQEVNPPSGQEQTKPPKHEQEANPPKTEKQEVPRPSGEQKKPAHEQHGTNSQQANARPAGKALTFLILSSKPALANSMPSRSTEWLPRRRSFRIKLNLFMRDTRSYF